MKTLIIILLALTSSTYAATGFTVDGQMGEELAVKLMSCGSFSFPEAGQDDVYSTEARDIKCSANHNVYSCHLIIPDESGIMGPMAPYSNVSKGLFEALVKAGVPETCQGSVCLTKASKLTCYTRGVKTGNMTRDCVVEL